jgi:hypothetical protein
MNNYDKSYLNRPEAILLIASVWKLRLQLRYQTSVIVMLCWRYYGSYDLMEAAFRWTPRNVLRPVWQSLQGVSACCNILEWLELKLECILY